MAGCMTTSNPTPEPVPTTPATSGAITSLQDVKKAVIQIESQGTFIDPVFGQVLTRAGRGSGFIIDPSGIAVTNNHVVSGAAMLFVWVGGETQPRSARVLGVSESSDLALIDIDGDNYDYLEWFAGAINVGMDIYLAGFPLGSPEYSMSRGVISNTKANGNTAWASVDSMIAYETGVTSFSGGPIVNPEGKVIGIQYADSSQTRQAFGLSRDIAISLIGELINGNSIDAIGVNGQAVISEDGKITGIWVSSVQSGSPADKAGLRPADIIVGIENLSMATDGTTKDYYDTLRSHNPGDKLRIEVLRWPTGEMLEGQLNGSPLEVR